MKPANKYSKKELNELLYNTLECEFENTNDELFVAKNDYERLEILKNLECLVLAKQKILKDEFSNSKDNKQIKIELNLNNKTKVINLKQDEYMLDFRVSFGN